jgi:hypothetical protein
MKKDNDDATVIDNHLKLKKHEKVTKESLKPQYSDSDNWLWNCFLASLLPA